MPVVKKSMDKKQSIFDKYFQPIREKNIHSGVAIATMGSFTLLAYATATKNMQYFAFTLWFIFLLASMTKIFEGVYPIKSAEAIKMHRLSDNSLLTGIFGFGLLVLYNSLMLIYPSLDGIIGLTLSFIIIIVFFNGYKKAISETTMNDNLRANRLTHIPRAYPQSESHRSWFNFYDQYSKLIDNISSLTMLMGIFVILLTFYFGNIASDLTITISFTLLLSAIWWLRKKCSVRFLLSLLILSTLLFVYTFSLENFNDWKNIETSAYLQKLDNLTVYDFQSHIMYDGDSTTLYQKILLSTQNIAEDTTSYVSFTVPEQTLKYNITMYGGTDNILFSNISTKFKYNDTYSVIHPNVTLKKDYYYNIETYFFMPKLDPYGSIKVELRGYNGQAKTDMSLRFYLGSFSYECTGSCITTPLKNEIGTPVLYNYDASIYPNQKIDRPSILYSVIGRDTGSIFSYIRAQNRYALIMRQLMLSIIAGLIVSLANIILTAVNRKQLFKSK